MSAALKIVVNSAYGYLGAGELTRFADINAANEITRRGRELLAFMCAELAARGVTLLEADTDGVYFAVPESWTEPDERRVVAGVATLLPPLVQLEFEGRYRAMLSHETKNYALLRYDGSLLLRGVAFRSSRSEPFGERFLRSAIAALLSDDIAGVRAAYLRTIKELRTRALPTYDVSSRVRLSRSPTQYLAIRERRREFAYEALLAAGDSQWNIGDRVRVYRKQGGAAGICAASDTAPDPDDARDYDVEYYERLLRSSFAERLARAFSADDFATVFAEPDQYILFARQLDAVKSILTIY